MEPVTPRPDLREAGTAGPDLEITDAGTVAQVEEVVRTLAKAVRAHQLYEGRSPSYDRFVSSLRESLLQLWESLPALVIDVEETRLLWEDHEVYRSEQRVESLSFLFYRDGIRQVVLLPGFEDREVATLLRLLAQVHRVREDQDDLLTLLWEADLGFLRYRHVEIAMEGLDLPARSGGSRPAIDPVKVRSDMERRPEGPWAGGPTGPAETGMDFQVSFQDVAQVLESPELQRLGLDLQREHSRNLWLDVINGLMDRLEDGSPDRQRRIVRVLTELLPGLIGGGQIAAAAVLLRDLAAFAARADSRLASGRREAEALFEQLASGHAVEELIRSVEDAPEEFPAEEFAELLGYFPASTLAPLITGIEQVVRPEVRRALEGAVGRLGERDPANVVELLKSSDPVLAAGAARLAGRLGIADAAAELGQLLTRPEREVRLAAVGALQEMKAGTAAGALVRVLNDPDREARIAAARALGQLRYPGAREPLERLLTSRRLRDADVTERLAFFESFGSVAGPEGVPVLDRLLNGRGWLGRRSAVEIRASAALALGRIGHPAAREALSGSSDDPDPVVRSAVTRALRSGDR